MTQPLTPMSDTPTPPALSLRIAEMLNRARDAFAAHAGQDPALYRMTGASLNRLIREEGVVQSPAQRDHKYYWQGVEIRVDNSCPPGTIYCESPPPLLPPEAP